MALNTRYVLPVAVGLLFFASLLEAQSKSPQDLRVGKLLVAQRDLSDPNFVESVILLINYGEDGAVGLILNRQTRLPILAALPDVKGSSKYSGSAYIGGPVNRGALMALLLSHSDPQPKERVFGDVFLVTRKTELETALTAGANSDELRIYFGYSGWGPGQLENEVRRGDWHIFSSTEQLVFDSTPSTLWERLIAQTEVRTAWAPAERVFSQWFAGR